MKTTLPGQITFNDMIKPGRYQTLTVSRISDYGLYLTDGEENEVLLPNRYVSLTDKVGDEKYVFVYHDSEDRLVATTETPLATVGQAACLQVVDKTLHGAFLDWGLQGKDLFLPNRNQQGGVMVGHKYIVYVYEDNITSRSVATMRTKTYINNDTITVEPRQKVEILICSESPIGYRVIVNDRHWGMIYKNQLFRPVRIGERTEAYVSRITPDARIDLSLQQQGLEQVRGSADELVAMLKNNDGELPVNDDTAPERVHEVTGMSKKMFKRSLGMLLKSGRVEITDNGIKLK